MAETAITTLWPWKGHQYETSEMSSVRHLAIYQKRVRRWSCYLKGQIKKRIMHIPTQNLTTMMRRKSIKHLNLRYWKLTRGRLVKFVSSQ